MTEEVDRLRRQLRALTAVNRQLQAQLEGTGGRAIAAPRSARAEPDLLTGAHAARATGPVRRSGVGAIWLEQLAQRPTGDPPFLARRPDGATFVVEGTVRRRLKAGLLTAALEQQFGERRDLPDGQFASLSEGPPIEVLEGPTGPPFIVIGGQRLPLRGLPLPHPVSAEGAGSLSTGRELALSPGSLAKAHVRKALSVRTLAMRAKRASARHGGLVPAASRFGRRQLGKVRRRVG